MEMLNMSENSSNAFFTNTSEDELSLNQSMSSLDLILFGKVFAGFDICLAPFIIGGNVLVLIAVSVEPKLQTISNSFIASLAVADLLVGILTIPLYSLFYLKVGNLEHNKFACLIRTGVAIYSCGSSLLNLLLMAFDRYLAVMYPLRYLSLMTPKRAKIALSVLWAFSTILSLLPIMGWNTWSENIPCDLYAVFPGGYIIIAVYIQVLGCLTFTTLMYVRIFYTAHIHHKEIRSTSTFASATFRKKLEKEFKTAKLMSLVLLLFVLFWLPYMASSALKYIKAISWEFVEVIKSFALCLSLSNSMVNPIVYAFLKKDFKDVFRKFISQIPCCKRYRLNNSQIDVNEPKTTVFQVI